MMIVVLGLGRLLRAGDFAPLPFMLIWLAAAGFGLHAGVRRLLLEGDRLPPGPRDTRWHDGIDRPPR
jgi:hypothetical protein